MHACGCPVLSSEESWNPYRNIDRVECSDNSEEVSQVADKQAQCCVHQSDCRAEEEGPDFFFSEGHSSVLTLFNYYNIAEFTPISPQKCDMWRDKHPWVALAAHLDYKLVCASYCPSLDLDWQYLKVINLTMGITSIYQYHTVYNMCLQARSTWHPCNVAVAWLQHLNTPHVFANLGVSVGSSIRNISIIYSQAHICHPLGAMHLFTLPTWVWSTLLLW